MDLSGKKVALVYDRVNKWGGAERVLLVLHEMFPEAPLYTSVYDKGGAGWARVFPKVIPSFLQKIPGAMGRHEWLVPLMPLAFESSDFSGFDVVISVSSEAAKGVITGPQTLHVCYCLTPPRYLWSQEQEYRGFHRYGVLSPFTRLLQIPLGVGLRQWDFQAAARPDVMMAISRAVAGRIRKYYGREAEVVYPPVDTGKWHRAKGVGRRVGGYYLVVSRLVPYKRVDLAVRVFNKLKWPLVVVGRGVEERRLKQMAGETVRFVGDLTDEELARYYLGAGALILPQEEDFGMVAVEALAAGVPVVAFAGGGGREIVEDGRTGVWFEEQSEGSLMAALEKLAKMSFDRKILIRSAERFSKRRFKEEFLKVCVR